MDHKYILKKGWKAGGIGYGGFGFFFWPDQNHFLDFSSLGVHQH